MIFKIENDKIEIISEDVMEAKYLESLFASSVYIVKESDFVRQGFNVTDERCICIKLSKGDN